MAAWSALGTSGVRWRDEAGDWEGVEEIGELADPDYYEEPSGALGPSASEGSDLFSFDDDFEAAEARRTGSAPEVEVGAPTNDDDDIADLDFMAPARPAVRPRAARAHGSSRSVHGSRGTRGRRGGDSSQLASRVVVGVGLIVLLAIAYAVGPKALLVLAAALIVACAAEAYSMLQRCGFRPATLLGLVGTAGVVLGSYWRGTSAIAVCVVLMFAGSMAWYLLRIVEARPLANAAVTNMVFTWTGVLGSFAAVMLRAHQGKGLFLGTVIVAVVADIGAYAVGRWIGSRPFAGSVSPGKTMEGFLGGWAAAIVAGAIVGKEISPWGGMKHGLLLGLLLGLVTAGGDLFESMLKRDLQLKDSGSLLGGHGGLLDRFDGILVALPFAYGLAWLFSIVK
jgi:CDP-diglyceride synthetase